jgi:hypothetical protein
MFAELDQIKYFKKLLQSYRTEGAMVLNDLPSSDIKIPWLLKMFIQRILYYKIPNNYSIHFLKFRRHISVKSQRQREEKEEEEEEEEWEGERERAEGEGR